MEKFEKKLRTGLMTSCVLFSVSNYFGVFCTLSLVVCAMFVGLVANIIMNETVGYEELKNITNEAISYEELEDTTNETIDYEELKGYNLRKFWIRFSVICTPILIGLLYAGESGLIPYQLAQSLGAGLFLAISPIIAVLQGYLMVKLIDKVEEWLSKHL